MNENYLNDNTKSIKDLIMAKEGKAPLDVEWQDGSSEGDQGDLKSLITNAPQLPKAAKNLILDASAIAKNEKQEKAQEITNSLNEVFSKYNKEYSLDLSIDFSSLSNTLVNVSDDSKRRALEIYVSKVFKTMRPLLLLHLIQRLTLAIDYITDPSRMFGGDLSTADVFVVVEKLISYCTQLNDLRKEIEIDQENVELKKLAEETGNKELDTPENKEAINEFMKLFRQEHK